jgi:hypothetical protein
MLKMKRNIDTGPMPPPAVTMPQIHHANHPLHPGISRVIIKAVTGMVSFLTLGCFSALAYSVSGTTFTTNGSVADVQSAVNAASAGATVVIPTGSYSWSTNLTINKAINLTGQSMWTGGSGVAVTGGVIITNALTNGGVLISATTPSSGHLIIGQLAILDGGKNSAGSDLFMSNGGTVPLLHDCYFDNKGSLNHCISWMMNGGVIWNCSFFNYEGTCGIMNLAADSANPGTSWQTPSTMGTADTSGTANTYIENCTFTNILTQALDPDSNSRTVIRYNKFYNTGCASHGQDTSVNGVRHWEIYNNTWTFNTSGTSADGTAYPLNLNWNWLLRGGTGVIFNNVMPPVASSYWGVKANFLFGVFNINQKPNAVPCQTAYPAARQLGQSWKGAGGYSYSTSGTAAVDGTGYYLDPVYLWGNTGGGSTSSSWIGLDQYTPDACGNGQLIGNYIKANRDYVDYGTANTPKPGYTPYTYPHPLRTLVSGATPQSTPLAPKNLTLKL